MSVILQSSGGGQITIQEPATASNFTQTLPSATGTVMVSGNMPAFRAFATSNQSVTANTNTLVALQAESFDTANCFNTSTYRFTPNVAGYYFLAGHFNWNTSAATTFFAIYLNGSEYNRGADNGSVWVGDVAALVYMNGSTDYVELRVQGTVTQSLDGRSSTTFFYGYLARAA
jgi:hypothetical protein